MATKTNRSNILLSVEVCGDGDDANGGSGGEGHPRESNGSLRNYKFRGGGGSEETKGGTLDS
jgi:hypothetical protein